MKKLSAMLALVMLAGCGGGSGGGGKNYDQPLRVTETEKTAATGSVESVSSMRTLATMDAGDNVAVTKVTGAWENLNQLVSAKQQAEFLDKYGSAMGGLSTVRAALDAGCYQQSEAGVVYDDCEYGDGTIDGTIDLTGDHLSIDLTITSNMLGNFVMTEFGELELSDTLVRGELGLTIEMNMTSESSDEYAIDYDVDALYDVVLTDGCPTGGTLEIHAISSFSGADIPGPYASLTTTDVWVKAEFGPSCGDVTIY